jgi:hypothetical protein
MRYRECDEEYIYLNLYEMDGPLWKGLEIWLGGWKEVEL